MKKLQIQSPLWRATGAITIASLFVPIVGCGAPAPQQTNSGFQPQNQRQMQAPQQGMSTRQKGTLLAGAAAMYFLYRKYQRDNAARLQQASAASPNGKVQFYRSRAGGYIYYRDPRNPRVAIKIPAQNKACRACGNSRFTATRLRNTKSFRVTITHKTANLGSLLPSSITFFRSKTMNPLDLLFGQVANAVRQHSNPNTPGPAYDSNPILGALAVCSGQQAQQTGHHLTDTIPTTNTSKTTPNNTAPTLVECSADCLVVASSKTQE
jgi:hypothetical protein